MNTFGKLALLGTLTLGLATVASIPQAKASTRVSIELGGVPGLRAGFVWAPGYWRWNRVRYAWVPGGWVRHYAGDRDDYRYARMDRRDDWHDYRYEGRRDDRREYRHEDHRQDWRRPERGDFNRGGYDQHRRDTRRDGHADRWHDRRQQHRED
ncbi:hypothetical protein [Oleiagrimonas sp.]|jgi:hypothetical protein|uniref:hypothetical protein n=1 Tax=Oleiagrimonas sp. TaxID=2010330 RepID=UPI002605D854|nr:hypothetical protein [Oleiagrimonas sp.]MDA3914774.1 hypothetical protein [Oleiagrimonas sp.]